MPALMHKGKNYSGGGTSVTANPTGTATADLTKVGIGSTIYNVKDPNAAHLVDGKVPASELPSFVDDVLEYASRSAFPVTGESGKIYVALDTNLTYRWGGSDYVEISQSLALGTTHQTAAYGDDAVSTAEPTYSEASTRTNLAGSGEKLSVIFGKIKKWFSDLKAVAFSGSYNDLTNTPAIPTVNNNKITIQLNGTTVEEFTLNQSSNETINIQVTKSDVGLENVGNFKAVSTVANQGLSNAEKGNARANIGAGTSNFDGAYSSLSGTPTLGTASAKDVPSSGDASTSQVVMGNDTRLSNARPASDVSSWAKASTKPTYTKSEVGLGNVPNVSTNDQTPTFTEASTRANIASGEKLSVILGKIKKWFTDLKTVAFTGAYSDLTGQPTIPAAVRVKGNAESDYRTGDVNLTPANIGALPLSGGTMTGDILGNSTAKIGHSNAKYPYGYFNNLNVNTLEMPSSSKIYFEESGTGGHNARPTTTLGNDDNLPTGGAVISYLNSNSIISCQQVQFTLPSAVSFNPYGTNNLLTTFDIKHSTIVDTVFTNKTLKQLFENVSIKGIVGLYTTAVLIRDCIVWPDTEKISVNAYNPWSQAQTVSAIRLLVFYSR